MCRKSPTNRDFRFRHRFVGVGPEVEVVAGAALELELQQLVEDFGRSLDLHWP